MKHATRIGRLGVLAVGLGIGAAVASTPGVASADDFDVSFDGFDLFHQGTTAHATSGMGDFAIAFGNGSNAVAEGGFGDFASADGTNSVAEAGSLIGSNFDSASALGTNSTAEAGFNGSFDSASAVGNGVFSDAGFGNLAVAPANFDSASVWGDLTTAPTNLTEAAAIGGSNDVAFVTDPLGTIGSAAVAGEGGNFDLAGVFGDNLTADSLITDFIAHIAPFF